MTEVTWHAHTTCVIKGVEALLTPESCQRPTLKNVIYFLIEG